MTILTKNSGSVKPPSGWLPVNKSSPCPVCGSSRWCMVSADGSAALCHRVESELGERGQAGWLHKLSEPLSTAFLPKARKHSEHESVKSSPEDLNKVYSALLGELELSVPHYEALRARGMSEEQIKAGQYRSFPRSGRPALVAKLTKMVHDGELPPLAGVPGFYMTSGAGGLSYANLSGSVGMLVPVRDALGRIVGLQVRLDSTEGGKYRWVSSSGELWGCSSGSPVHVAGGSVSSEYAFITEGPLKADIASARLGCPVLGVAGVSNYAGVVELLQSMGIKRVVTAYDMDKVDNIQVKHHASELVKILMASGLEVYESSWLKTLKGIDDFLTSSEFYVQHIAKLPILASYLAKIGLVLKLRGLKKSSKRLSSKERVYGQHYDMLNGRGWLAWRDYLESRERFFSLDCLQYGHKWECADGGEHLFEPTLCGDWHYCVICGFRYEQIQAESAMYKFMEVSKALPGVSLQRIVWTLPQELWTKITWGKFGLLTAMASESLAEVMGGQVAGEHNCQYWHSETPLPDKNGLLYPHVHSAVLNVVRTPEGEYKVIPAYVDELALKTAWARRLAKQFKLEFRINEASGKPQLKLKHGWSNINLRLSGYVPLNNDKYVYSRGKRKGQKAQFSNAQYLKARLRYDFRLPQADIAEYAQEAGIERFSEKQKIAIDVLVGYESAGVRLGLPKNFRRERWFGWLSDGVVKKRLAELNIAIKSASERKKEAKAEVKPVVCPVHSCQCSVERGQFGQALKKSRYDLEVGDLLLDANFKNNKRYWRITQEVYERWHEPKESRTSYRSPAPPVEAPELVF